MLHLAAAVLGAVFGFWLGMALGFGLGFGLDALWTSRERKRLERIIDRSGER